MKLSTRSRCGTRILMDLARLQNEGPVQVGEISRRQNISVKYVEQIIRPLKQAELINSVRGPKGGHMLAKKPEEITLGLIVRLLESSIDLAECVGNPDMCLISTDCRIRVAWQDATEALYKSLDATTIADLIR